MSTSQKRPGDTLGLDLVQQYLRFWQTEVDGECHYEDDVDGQEYQ